MSESVQTIGPRMLRRLARLEKKVQKGLTAFREAGKALAEIHDQHLYKQDYDTFEQYVIHRWGMSRSQAYRLIDGAQIAELLSPNGDTEGDEETAPLQHEAHARALQPLKDQPEVLRIVWDQVNREHEGEVTAEVVKTAVRERLRVIDGGGESEPEPEAKPAPGAPFAIHVEMSLTEKEAREALLPLLDIKPAPSALTQLRAQIEQQLASKSARAA